LADQRYAGADLELVNDRNRTPLHCACISFGVERVLLLLAGGADALARSDGDKTSLHLAVLSNQETTAHKMDVVHALLASGADLENV
jgi:ankyrin repeat protein